VAQRFMGQRELRGMRAILRGQQPARQPLLDRVEAGQLFKEFGFTVDNVVANVEAVL